MKNNNDVYVLKNFILRRSTRNYIEYKDYFDRFFVVFVVFTFVSIAAQCYSGYSELSFFEVNAIFYQLPYPFYFALLGTIFLKFLNQ
ncbi:MAG: hypothetical protein CMO01_02960 [Thalassobius sp.]|nr:hypothetical protein [Thalassovita sp.]